MKGGILHWTCPECLLDIFPFQNCDNQSISELFFSNSILSCQSSNICNISSARLENLPCYNIMTSISNSPHLKDHDIDLHLPCETNFSYYTPHQFHSSEEITNLSYNKSFSVLHLNIRSLSANFDPLCTLLSNLNHSFSVIGLSETKIKHGGDPIINIDLPGYNFISQPTVSNAGGVGFYIKTSVAFNKREDLCTSDNEHESLWIEIESNHQHNIICGVVYRHPNANINMTLKYIYSIIEKIHNENKYCIMMGDFNINLLNYETHPDTDAFINRGGNGVFSCSVLG